MSAPIILINNNNNLSLSSGLSRIQLSITDLCFNGAPKLCLTTGFVNTCNRDRPITITTGLRYGFKIKSHKFLWEHLKKLLQNKGYKLKINKKNLNVLLILAPPTLAPGGACPSDPPSYATAPQSPDFLPAFNLPFLRIAPYSVLVSLLSIYSKPHFPSKQFIF